jgi:hypothetical protein
MAYFGNPSYLWDFRKALETERFSGVSNGGKEGSGADLGVFGG